MKNQIAALVPAHDEENVIGHTIKSLAEVIDRKDIYVVSDGSTDTTVDVAKSTGVNVLALNPNVGKATAMNKAIEFFEIPRKYEFILPMDADTKITPDFVNNILTEFAGDKKREYSCVVGKVVGTSHRWVTSFRLWEYEIAQSVHKAAQSEENSVIVCPGCATVYRASIFEKLKVPTGTLTEDMDMTFQIHRQKLGRIVFTQKAVVVTQDPENLKDFVKQIDRWYTGFWQCVAKNNIPWGGQVLDLEVAMLGIEGLFNGVLMLSLLFLLPWTLLNHPALLVIPFFVDLLFFLIPTMLLTARRHNHWKIFIYLPFFYIARFVACIIFLKSFIKTVLATDRKMGWNKVNRYSIN